MNPMSPSKRRRFDVRTFAAWRRVLGAAVIAAGTFLLGAEVVGAAAAQPDGIDPPAAVKADGPSR